MFISRIVKVLLLIYAFIVFSCLFKSTSHELKYSVLDPYTVGKSDLLGTKPVAYLICNQTPPQKDKPSLMTFREVETLFHEVSQSKNVWLIISLLNWYHEEACSFV